MNAAALQPIEWSRRRWITTVGVLLIIHVVLIFYFGERSHRLPRALRSKTSIYLAVDPWSARQIEEMPGLADPALFALPSLQGFSGKAWLTFDQMEYPAGRWTSPPVYLALESSRLATDISNVVEESLAPIGQVAARPLHELLAGQIPVVLPPIASGSELRIEGDLRDRPLLESIEVPSWAHPELLTNSVVQLLVARDGTTLSARLVTSSGSGAADDWALKHASTARFEPAAEPNSGGSSFGRLVFQWHTLAPVETNALPVNR